MSDEYDYEEPRIETATRIKGALAGLFVGLLVVFGLSFVGKRSYQTNYQTRIGKKYTPISWPYYALGGLAFATYGFIKPTQIKDILKQYIERKKKGF